MFLTNAVACVIGGVIVHLTDRIELTLIIASIVGLMGSFTVIVLKEPKVERRFMESFKSQLGKGAKQVMKSRPIMILISFQIILSLGTYVMAIFRSVYMNEDLELGYLEIGLFFASFAMVGGAMGRKANRIEAMLGENGSLMFMFAALVMSFTIVFLVRSPAAVFTQYMMYMIVGIQSPIINGYINRLVDSSYRSTVMAIASMMFTVAVVVVEVCTGWIAAMWGLEESLLVLALASTPLGISLLVLWRKEVRKFSRPSTRRDLQSDVQQ